MIVVLLTSCCVASTVDIASVDIGFVPTRGDAVAFQAQDAGVACRVDATGFSLFDAWSGERLRFEAPSGGELEAHDALPGVVHEFLGTDPENHRTDLRHYACVRLAWPDLALEFRRGAQGFEYDLIAESPEALARFEFSVGTEFELDEASTLRVFARHGVFEQRALESFVVDVNGHRYPLAGNIERRGSDRIGFVAPAIAGPVVIDPGLQFSTYLGSTLFDEANDVAVDATGATFVCGSVSASDFPVVAGSYDTSFGGTFADAFVAKLAQNGTLVWATFLGGSSVDSAQSLALATDGRVHVGGRTQSSDFPVSTGAFDTTSNGGIDGFVAGLAADGKSLAFSSYLGGSADDEVRSLALGVGNAIFVAGYTGSIDFPATVGAYDTSFNGAGPVLTDGFVARLASTATSLTFASFFGGEQIEVASGVALSNGDPVIVGRTESTDLPTSASSHDPTYGGGLGDAFHARFDPTGAILRASTYVGGTDRDAFESVATSSDGTVFSVGFTRSVDLSILAGPDLSPAGLEDGFLFVFNANDVAAWGSYLGGAADDRALSIALDPTGASYVTGRTASSNYPAQTFAFDSTYNGATDAFFSKIRPGGIGGYNETGYLGGAGFDEGRAIAVASGGIARIVGRTTSSNFPVLGAPQSTLKGSSDAFVASLPTAICPNPPTTSVYGTGKAGQNGIPVLGALGLPAIPSTTMILQIINAKPGAIPLLFLGFAPIAVPFDNGTLLTNPLVIVTLPPFNAQGRLDVPTPFGEDVGLCGISLYLQSIYIDPVASGFYHTAQTNGLVLTFGS